MELAYASMKQRQLDPTTAAERVFDYVILLTKVDKLSYSDIVASLTKKQHRDDDDDDDTAAIAERGEGGDEERELLEEEKLASLKKLQVAKKKGIVSRRALMTELKERSYLVEHIQETWRRITTTLSPKKYQSLSVVDEENVEEDEREEDDIEEEEDKVIISLYNDRNTFDIIVVFFFVSIGFASNKDGEWG